jgi:hypothetical protein
LGSASVRSVARGGEEDEGEAEEKEEERGGDRAAGRGDG